MKIIEDFNNKYIFLHDICELTVVHLQNHEQPHYYIQAISRLFYEGENILHRLTDDFLKSEGWSGSLVHRFFQDKIIPFIFDYDFISQENIKQIQNEFEKQKYLGDYYKPSDIRF